MFENILVPTDLTDKTREALEIAIGMAGMGAGQVTLLHVIEKIEDSEDDMFNEFYRKLERRSIKLMDKLAAQCAHEGININRAVIFGKRVGEIVRYAAEHHIDLVVISSHRIHPEIVNYGWTISYQVGVLAPCHVMLVK